MPTPTPLAVCTFFARLQERAVSPSRQHQVYRTLRTFLRWCVEAAIPTDEPLRGFTMRTPRTLPEVPTEGELRSVLQTRKDAVTFNDDVIFGGHGGVLVKGERREPLGSALSPAHRSCQTGPPLSDHPHDLAESRQPVHREQHREGTGDQHRRHRCHDWIDVGHE